jgi:hypothetical protein
MGLDNKCGFLGIIFAKQVERTSHPAGIASRAFGIIHI